MINSSLQLQPYSLLYQVHKVLEHEETQSNLKTVLSDIASFLFGACLLVTA